MELYKLNLHLFDANHVNVTTDSSLSDEMKTYYSTYLIRLAAPLLVHDQFGQKQPIPKNGGKIIEFRKWGELPKITTYLTEGTTPTGQDMSMSVITSALHQYGGFITLSDVLTLTAIDNTLMEATKMIGDQAGKSLDTVTREVINAGTNVQYGASTQTSRYNLVGGETSGNDYMTVDTVRRAIRALKVQNAKKINGDFVAIIHPDCTYDLMSDPNWKYPHQYVDTKNIYEGEIGKIEGCRFVETTEAKVFHAADLASDSRTLLASAAISASSTTISFDGGTVAAHALKGRTLQLYDATNGYQMVECTDNTASAITIKTAITALADNAVIYPGEAGKKGRDVYSTLFIGADAYGVTELEGGGLQVIVKQLGSAGTADPLNQRATVGWKAMKTAEILVDNYMLRAETCSTFESGAN